MAAKNPKRILVVAGTRPEIIKLAPILLKARGAYSDSLTFRLLLTGQHESMVDEALSLFEIREDHNLRIMSANQTLNDISRNVFELLPPILRKSDPDVVMVQGDTTSAAVAAHCAFNMRIPVAHVEAGLRSFNLEAPFPEEMNRKSISCVARYNFCPTETARNNLLREAVPGESIFLTGNTIVDALRIIAGKNELGGLTRVHASIRTPFVLVTAHRRESFGPGIQNICEALKTSARKYPHYQFVYPVHLNPSVDKPVREYLNGLSNILLLKPISYRDLLTLLRNCAFAVTDSGGIQEEAPSFSKFCIVLRDVTERVESIQLGIAELVGTNVAKTCAAIDLAISRQGLQWLAENPYGDGNASTRILDTLLKSD